MSGNDVVIDSQFNATPAITGASDLEARFAALKTKLEDMKTSGAEAGDVIGASFGGSLLGSLMGSQAAMQALHAVISTGISLWQETKTAVADVAAAYDAATDAYDKYMDAQEKSAKSGAMAPDRLGDSSFENTPEKIREQVEELGRIEAGLATSDSAVGRLQDAVRSLGPTFGGNLGKWTDKELFEAGKPAADRERALEKNAEEKAARDKMLAEGFAAEMVEEDKRFAMKQEQQAKASVKADEDQEKRMEKEAAGRLKLFTDLDSAEERKAQMAQSFERGEAMRALSKDKSEDKGFAATIESFEAVFTRMQTAAGGDDATERNKRHREEVARKQDELRQKWHEEDMAKQDELIAKIQGGLA